MWFKCQRSKDDFLRLKVKGRRPKVEIGTGKRKKEGIKNEGFSQVATASYLVTNVRKKGNKLRYAFVFSGSYGQTQKVAAAAHTC
jgi:hypothetical protein